ncbi:MAG: amidohydrolase family protein [Bacteroidia bacterium]
MTKPHKQISIANCQLLIAILFLLLSSCNNKKADAVYYNGLVYTVDSTFKTVEAFAVKDGKIIATGSKEEILKYDAKEQIDLKGKFVYPGFIDAHCHFYGYGVDLKKINLTGTKSFADVIDTVIKYKDKKFSGWIFGRGWDQNDWEVKQYPDKTQLDSLFPDVPVFLMRIDGHAALVNQKAIDIAKLSDTSSIIGGEFEKANAKLTGLLIDNAVDLVKDLIPLPSRENEIEALLNAQKNCFAVGLTTIDDAGLEYQNILLIDSLQKLDQLKMRYYAMITYNDSNKNYFYKTGKIKTDRLNVCSFKLYGDGALGSRGACLLEDYADMKGHRGFLLHPLDSFQIIADDVAKHDFQLCTHAIGDSANRLMLNVYGKALAGNDLRWRIEHAQVVNENDFALFGKYKVIPSVQPTHATSDMYWADVRLGKERIKGAYAYKQLMKSYSMIAAGSDFPVEDINPLYGFYAAVVRRDKQNYPDFGFQTENAISRIEALKAMTIWAAYSNFEEKEKGSLEPGKFADFVILENDLMTSPPASLWQIKVLATYINGEKIYTKD